MINHQLKKYRILILLTILVSIGFQSQAQKDLESILPMRNRVQLMDGFWKWKLEHVLPAVMREQGVDLWIIRSNEADLYYNNEGPIFTSLLPTNFEGMTYASSYAGPGSQQLPSFLMFHDTGAGLEYLEPENYDQITTLVRKFSPSKIAIGEYNNEAMLKALGKHKNKSIDSWTLGVRWLETMSTDQILIYRHVQSVANDIIAEGFTNAAVIPGITTTDDLNWWFRHRYLEAELEIENHPSVVVKRRPANISKYKYIDGSEKFRNGCTSNGISVTIQPGDVISLDSDIMLIGLVTDSHQHAYVLQKGESEVPQELKNALNTVNKMQDLFAAEFKFGRTGKEIVAASDKIKRLPGVIESELGFHPPPMFIRRYLKGGYMFSHKTYVAGMTSGPGYYPTSIVTNNHKLFYNTMYAFEPHTSIAVPGWGEHGLEIGIGQIAVFEEDGLRYLDRPQETKWHVIK
ncbi:M24 family metallopeptidase [Maribacter antarcticus]|uniref:M24 family metallopeptidase n=1 Tax=Maribacter antarcticus TaxID=505250 RepID=UPI00047C47BA|nr:M24 family metallopeptidase [Maribacter antarcticus]